MRCRVRPSLVLSSLFLAFPFVAAHADCSVKVEPAKDSLITEDGDLVVGFNVQGQPCSAGCKGEIAIRVLYLNTEGEPQTYQESVPWSSEDGKLDSVKLKAYRDSCNNNRFGPCRVQTVEVVQVSCTTAT